jgi:hypothetical protein
VIERALQPMGTDAEEPRTCLLLENAVWQPDIEQSLPKWPEEIHRMWAEVKISHVPLHHYINDGKRGNTMTVTLILTPEKQSRLTRRASAAGLSLDGYVQRVVDLAAVETDEEEQARLNQALDALLLEAQSMQPLPRVEAEGPSSEGSFEDAVVAKYRRQGFNL